MRQTTNNIFDKSIATCAALIPTGIVIGSVVFEGMIALSILLWLIQIAIVRKNPLKNISKHPLFYPAILWFLSIFISLLVNGAGSRGFWHDVALLRFVLFLFAVLDISKRVFIFKYFLYGVFFSFIFAITNILLARCFNYNIFNHPIYYYYDKGKRLGNISVFFTYISPIFLSICLFVEKKSKIKKLLYFLLSIIAFIVILYSKVKTIIIASFVGLAFVCFYFLYKKTSFLISFVVIAICILIASYVFLKINNGLDYSLTGRTIEWKGSFLMWKNNPFFGVGVSSYRETYAYMLDSRAFEPSVTIFGQTKIYLDKAYHCHNIILDYLTCTGIMGLISLIWIYINTIKIILKNLKTHIVFMSFPIVFFTIGLTGWSPFDSFYASCVFYFLAFIGGTKEKI